MHASSLYVRRVHFYSWEQTGLGRDNRRRVGPGEPVQGGDGRADVDVTKLFVYGVAAMRGRIAGQARSLDETPFRRFVRLLAARLRVLLLCSGTLCFADVVENAPSREPEAASRTATHLPAGLQPPSKASASFDSASALIELRRQIAARASEPAAKVFANIRIAD
jgi:hypothetical protein